MCTYLLEPDIYIFEQKLLNELGDWSNIETILSECQLDLVKADWVIKIARVFIEKYSILILELGFLVL